MDTVIENEEVLAANRWTDMFGIEEDSKHDFVDYLGKRMWQVRGEMIDAKHSDRTKAPASYVKSMISESKYWESKDEIKCVYDAVVDKARVTDGYTYKPVDEQTISNENCEQVMFNTYEAPDTSETVATDEELTLWNVFWENLLKDEVERSRVQQWIASLAFHPEKKTCVAILLHGLSTGTGKTTVGEVLSELVGSRNTTAPANSMESLTGKFNAGLEGKVLFVVNELYEGNSFKLADGIKGKITESKIEVEPKGKELRKIDNYCNFFTTSNDLTPLWLDSEDRRWEVYNVEYDEDTIVQHKGAASAFRGWFEADRVHATSVIRSILRNVDISDYLPWKDGALMTEAKRKLVASSVSSKQDDFEVYWNQQKSDDDMVVNASKLFVEEWRRIATGQRTKILTSMGCKKLNSNSSVKIGDVQSRAWWITPKGLSSGLNTFMNGKEIGEILKKHRSDVTGMSYDAESDSLRVDTQMAY